MEKYRVKITDKTDKADLKRFLNGYLEHQGKIKEYSLEEAKTKARMFGGAVESVYAEYKFLFIELEERNGEQEYTFRLIRQVLKEADNDSIAEYEAENWYGSVSEKIDDHYEFFGGCIFVSVKSVREISYDDYLVLTKYL